MPIKAAVAKESCITTNSYYMVIGFASVVVGAMGLTTEKPTLV